MVDFPKFGHIYTVTRLRGPQQAVNLEDDVENLIVNLKSF